MFELSWLDHLCLTFGHVVSRHKAHARLAASCARWSRGLRIAEALMIAGVAFLAAYAAMGKGHAYEIATAVLAAVGLATLIVHQAADFDGAARAHAACATQLWQAREQYRALLADLSDGAIQIDAARVRRDELMNQVHHIYENAPPADQHVYRGAGQTIATAADGVLTEDEIDQLLPMTLRKAWKSGAA